MSKQGRGKMRRIVWLLTITPLVALCLAASVAAIAHAAGVPTASLAVHIAASEDVAMGTSSTTEELTLAFQTTVTPTTPSITPSIVLPRLTPAATPIVTATVQISPTPSLTNTTALSATRNLSSTTNLSDTRVLTSSVAVTETTSLTATDEATLDQVLDAEYAGPIEGTIVANRTESNVRFFVEGATYELAPLRSIGLALPRVTAVLNLFNCDATLPETQEGCFWDPYLLDREGFYEVTSGEEAGATAGLTLQAAGTPPGNQVWLQNRTGKREQIFYGGGTYDLPPSTVQEFITDAEDSPVLFYLRSCLDVAGRSVCEWTPNEATPGIYYALVEVTASGTVPDSSATALQLQPLFAQGGDAPPEVAPEATPAAPTQVLCRVDVPTLNVRSGPGLQYQIISKVRSSEQDPVTVLVIGRDAEAQWFAVEDRVAPGGWVTGSSGFVTCQGDIVALPVIEVPNAELAPTPVTEPVVVEPVPTIDTTAVTEDTPAPVDNTTVEVAPIEAAPTATVAVQALLDGQSMIVINNGFEQQVRFTLDQRYRIVEGPSEYDLQPGQSVSLLVYPGPIAFSASSPWNGLSGNEEFLIADKETRNLWIIFVPDPDGSGGWLLQY